MTSLGATSTIVGRITCSRGSSDETAPWP
jgi:hypothetical protein